FVWLAFPLTVVIMTTPLAAREPYNEVDAASLRIDIFSISSGLILAMSPDMGKPSTTYNGLLPPLTDNCPLILIDIPSPGLPEVCLIWTPANLPCSFWDICATG